MFHGRTLFSLRCHVKELKEMNTEILIFLEFGQRKDVDLSVEIFTRVVEAASH